MYLTGLIFKNISGNNKVGLLAMAAVAINPWAINFGRTAYENSFSFVFYLAAIALFSQKKVKSRTILLAIGLAAAAALSYFGAKVLFFADCNNRIGIHGVGGQFQKLEKNCGARNFGNIAFWWIYGGIEPRVRRESD